MVTSTCSCDECGRKGSIIAGQVNLDMAIIRATSLVASCKGGVINGATLSLDTSRLLFVLFDRVGLAQVLVWSLFTTKFKT